MKISDIFRSFMDARNLSLRERIRVCYVDYRRSSSVRKEVDMETLYKIVGHINEPYASAHPGNIRGHPIDIKNPNGTSITDKYAFDWDSYIKRIEEKIHEYKMENHIIAQLFPDSVFIPEKSVYYKARCKITIKNLTISASNFKRKMYFYSPSSSAKVDIGIYLIFENNNFVDKPRKDFLDFYLQGKAYFVFKNNKFKFVDCQLISDDVAKIEFKNNLFEYSHLSVKKSSVPNPALLDIICLDNNIFYQKDEHYSQLETNLDAHFKGKNTVDNLILGGRLLHWGGLQNIDPHGKHAHTHKPIFTKFMKAATEKNDKMQEAKLRKEWLKCERALLSKESTWEFLQDKIIIWWIWLISDYGTLCLRPILWLVAINAILASVVLYSFEHQSSWLLLFAEFFNPLSYLSTTADIKGNGWISLIAILQKGFFAASVYEAIKIFRRFSSK